MKQKPPTPPARDLDAKTFRPGPGAVKEKQRQRVWKPASSRTAQRPYIELHAASAFSFLDGASLPEDLVEQAANLGLPAMALIDSNGVYGAPRFYGAAKKAGLRALVGAEIVLEDPLTTSVNRQLSTDNLLTDNRQPSTVNPLRLLPDSEHPRLANPLRLTLLVESRAGYRNLCRLLTAGALRNPKGEARYRWEDLREFGDGLHCLTGGDEGPLAFLLNQSGLDASRKYLEHLQSIFPQRLHVELQRHHRRDEEHRNQALVGLSRSLRLPLLATNGVRYARDQDKELFDVLTCIRHGTHLDVAGQLLHAHRQRHLKTALEMNDLFVDLPEALDHSFELAQKLDFTLADLGYRFPDYPLPPDETKNSFLRKMTWNSARARFRPLTSKAQRQIERELDLIEKLDLAGYFLIVWDIVQFCQREKILVQGRGSAANSAVCYALGITAVDPVKMELLFERFLSEERGEWPDIDLDLPSGDQRERVIQHVYQTYGVHGAAMTANVITYRDRSAAREVGKSLGYSPEQVDKLAAQIGRWTFGEIRETMNALPSELAAAGLDPEELRVRHLMRLWVQIQNLPRHLGQHSGGMVMAGGRLDEVVPLEPASMPGRVVIQWDKDDCADLGIIKVDLLGLGMLNALERAIPMIRDNEGINVDLAHLPQDDPRVYKMLNEADTVGVFQLESRAQMATLPKNAPRVFYDLVVQVAIIRPGPIVGGMVRPFFARRQGKQPVEYAHPCLEPILKRTLGVPLFQEQLLRMAMVAAGFTGGEAEELRRAMGFKRSMERMVDIEQRLRLGMEKNGIGPDAQDQIVKSITSFALYGFPESHAASFALIAYASAYIRAYHPAAFCACLLNAWPMGFYHPASIIKDAQRHGVDVRPIDVTRSGWECRWEDGAIRMGLRFVKGLREMTGRLIEAEQGREPFRSVEDLARRCNLREDQLSGLAYAGTLAAFGLTRRAAIWQADKVARRAGPLLEEVSDLEKEVESVPEALVAGHSNVRRRNESSDLPNPAEHWNVRPQPSLDARDETAPARSLKDTTSPLPEMTPFQETLADYGSMDITTGPHLVEHLRPELRQEGVLTAAQLCQTADGSRVLTAGAVIVRQRPGTAKGFVFLTLEDETGMSQAIVKPDLFRDNRALIVGSAGLVVQGILQNEGTGQCSIRAEHFWPLKNFAPMPSHDFH